MLASEEGYILRMSMGVKWQVRFMMSPVFTA